MSPNNKDDDSDDDDTFFVIILPVTIVIFVSIFTYLFVGYMKLKKHLRNSGQVISALPFLILPDEQPEIRSPDGHLPPPAYNATVETHYENINPNNNNNNDEGVVNYHHPSLTNFSLERSVNNHNNNDRTRRERRRSRSRANRQGNNERQRSAGPRGAGGMLGIGPGVMHQQSGPPSTEIMLERPPPVYSIESSADNIPNSNGRHGRRDRRKESRPEHIAMNDIAPPPYSAPSEVPVN